MTVIDRVTVDRAALSRAAARAKRAAVRTLRVVASAVLAVFYAAGWLVGNVVVGVLSAVAYVFEAVRLGWSDARGGRRGAD